MPKISSKGIKMPESPIRKLVPFAEGAKQKGKTVFHLNIGQPDIKSPEVALDAIHNFNDKVVEYSHSAGFESYRKGLANYYQKVGINIDHSDVMVTTGGSEALLFALNTCMDNGDEIIIPEPFYANYNGFSISAGVKVKPITTSINDGFALPAIEEFEKLITPNTKAILICNPGNPTGYLYSKEELETLRDIVIKHDLFLFADEVYREFCYDGNTHHSVLNIEGLEQHAVVIDSTSKRYSLCGIRVGCLISKNKEVMTTALKFAQARLSPPTFGQVAGEAALSTPTEYFDEVSEEYVARRDLLIEGLNKIEGVICPKPKGAFYCIAQLPVDNADKFAQWLLEEFDHNGKTLMVAPAAGFYSTPNTGTNQVRIAYVLNQDSLTQAIECLDKALEVYPGRTL
ncbi:MAG: pyridoxal phosphate-dependent aminotransferase [Flavobacteriales bacterium]|nr:pyridoxal phosphate-dependent aminotransferase [Flavobacteriales bacterium]MBL6873734.1 pyridoxal phosphate-dependent aminotransferase [Flavobacteriales bacterium]